MVHTVHQVQLLVGSMAELLSMTFGTEEATRMVVARLEMKGDMIGELADDMSNVIDLPRVRREFLAERAAYVAAAPVPVGVVEVSRWIPSAWISGAHLDAVWDVHGKLAEKLMKKVLEDFGVNGTDHQRVRSYAVGLVMQVAFNKDPNLDGDNGEALTWQGWDAAAVSRTYY